MAGSSLRGGDTTLYFRLRCGELPIQLVAHAQGASKARLRWPPCLDRSLRPEPELKSRGEPSHFPLRPKP